MALADFRDDTPVAPTGRTNVRWQKSNAYSPPHISANYPNIGGVNVQTGTSYTVQLSDQGKLISLSNASAVAVALPGSTSPVTLESTFFCAIENRGAGTVTLTSATSPVTSTIDGAASLTLTQNQGCWLFFDGTNWFTDRGIGGSGGSYYQTVQHDGTPVTQRAKLNVAGGANLTVTATDNGTDTTTLTLAVTPTATPANLVQSNSGSANTPSSLAVAFTSSNSAGNCLIVDASYSEPFAGANTMTISDTLGNTWSKIGQVTDNNINSIVWVAYNCLAGANTVTVTTSNGSSGIFGNGMVCAIHEYAGVLTASAFDAFNTNTANSTTSVSTSLTSTAATDLLHLAVTGFSVGGTLGNSAGWTQRRSVVGSGATYNVSLASFDASAGAAGTQSNNGTSTSATTYLLGFLIALKVASASVGNVTHTTGALTADLPVFGNGAGDIKVGTKSGNTTEVMSATGSFTSGNIVKTDANGNAIDAGIAASAIGGAGGTTTTGSVGIPNFVQGNTAAGPPSGGTGVSSVTCAFTSGNTAGNCLIVDIAWSTQFATSITVTDSQGNTWTQIQSGGTTLTSCVSYNCAAGSNTVTVTFNGGVSACVVAIHEYSGIAHVSAVDVSSIVTNTAVTSVSTSVTTTNSPDILHIAWGTKQNIAAPTISGTTAREYLAVTTSVFGSNANSVATFDAPATTAGLYTVTASTAPTAANFPTLIVLALKASNTLVTTTDVTTTSTSPLVSGGLVVATSATTLGPCVLTTTGTSGPATLSAGVLNIPAYSGGGGSASITRGAYASLPGSPASGDVYLCSDAPYTFFYDGSAWQPYAFGMPVTLPPGTGSLTWVNQGSATADSSIGMFTIQSASGGTNVRAMVKSAPAAPYTWIVGVLCSGQIGNFVHTGMVLRDSSSGKIITFGPGTANGLAINLNYWNSATSHLTGAKEVAYQPLNIVFLKIVDDGTNHTYYVGTTPWTFRQFYQASRTVHLANPNQVGFGIDPENFDVILSIFHSSGV